MELTQDELVILDFLNREKKNGNHGILFNALVPRITGKSHKEVAEILKALETSTLVEVDSSTMISITEQGVAQVEIPQASKRKIFSIEERRSARLKFLKRTYEMVNGAQDVPVWMKEVGADLGFDDSLTRITCDYLVNEGYIQHFALGGRIAITHFGIKEYENHQANPDSSSDKLPSYNFVFVNSMTNSQIQQGTIDSRQEFNLDQNTLDQICELIQALETELNGKVIEDIVRTEMDAEIDTLKAQLKSTKPKKIILEESLSTLRNIIEGTLGGLISGGVIQKLTQILQSQYFV